MLIIVLESYFCFYESSNSYWPSTVSQSGAEDADQSTEEPKKKQPKLESADISPLSSAEELNEKDQSVVETTEEVVDTVSSADQTNNAASETISESRPSESTSIDPELAVKVTEQIPKPIDDLQAAEKESTSEEVTKDAEVAPLLADVAKESSAEAIKDAEVASLLTDAAEESSTEATKDAEVALLLTDAAKESSTEAADKKIDESANMETEEPSPVNEKVCIFIGSLFCAQEPKESRSKFSVFRDSRLVFQNTCIFLVFCNFGFHFGGNLWLFRNTKLIGRKYIIN